jgi:Amidohydrolase
MQDPDAAVKELHRAVGELGLRGAEIGPNVEDTFLDHPTVRPVLHAAEALGVPLILHPYSVGPRPGLEDFYLTNLIGNPLATTVCAARLILGGTLDELADLRLVLMHGGGYLPYQIGRLDHGHWVRPEAKACRQPPSAYLARFTYDTILHAPGPLRSWLTRSAPTGWPMAPTSRSTWAPARSKSRSPTPAWTGGSATPSPGAPPRGCSTWTYPPAREPAGRTTGSAGEAASVCWYTQGSVVTTKYDYKEIDRGNAG